MRAFGLPRLPFLRGDERFLANLDEDHGQTVASAVTWEVDAVREAFFASTGSDPTLERWMTIADIVGPGARLPPAELGPAEPELFEEVSLDSEASLAEEPIPTTPEAQVADSLEEAEPPGILQSDTNTTAPRVPQPPNRKAIEQDINGMMEKNAEDVFSPDYMLSMIDAPIPGENDPELNRLMESLLNPDIEDDERDAILNNIASIRGFDDDDRKAFLDQYDDFVEFQGNTDALDLDQHGRHLGSTASLRFGKVVGDVLGLDPVFGSLLRPTGGILGPGNSSHHFEKIPGWTPGDTHPLDYHAVFHDAGGYLLVDHDLGPGYDYLDVEDGDPRSSHTGQVSGIAWWNGQDGVDESRLLNAAEWGVARLNDLDPSKLQQGVDQVKDAASLASIVFKNPFG